MNDLPVWWGYVGPSAAVLSLIVSVGAFTVASSSYRTAVATYERAGHKVRLWFLPEFKLESGKCHLHLYVVIRNQGLASVQIESISIAHATLFFGSTRIDLTNEKSASLLSGEPVPRILLGNSVIRLKFDVRRAVVYRRGKFRNADAGMLFRFVNRGTLNVGLGDGTMATYQRFLGHFMMGERDTEERRRLLSHEGRDAFELAVDDEVS